MKEEVLSTFTFISFPPLIHQGTLITQMFWHMQNLHRPRNIRKIMSTMESDLDKSVSCPDYSQLPTSE